MKKLIIVLFCCNLNAGENSNNPNGEPWLLTIKYGKHNPQFTHHEDGHKTVTTNLDFVLPINNLFTIKTSHIKSSNEENSGIYSTINYEMTYFKYELELHLPLNNIFGNN